MSTDIALFQKEIDAQVGDPKTAQTLITTVFKGLQPDVMKAALLEGRIRGFDFKAFLDKDIYAVPYGKSYALVNSVDYIRKTGMKSGIVGKLAPKYTETDGKIETCEVTVKRMVNGFVGEFTALVYFKEYYAGHKNEDGTIKKNAYGDMKPGLWDTKPHTMIAKVAEMHALRMACPEVLAQAYIEEEMEKGAVIEKPEVKIDIEQYRAKLEACKTLGDLTTVWLSLPVEAKKELEALKNEMKTKVGQIVAEVVHDGEITLSDIEKI